MTQAANATNEKALVIGLAHAEKRAAELALQCVFFEVIELPGEKFSFSVEVIQSEQVSRSSETPYRLPTNAEFDSMSMAELCAWYVEAVGYSPIEDCPEIELGYVRNSCKEHALIERCGGLDLRAYQLVESSRKSVA